MKLLIFGASGATGIHLVEQALSYGHHVTAFVRRALKLTIKHPNLRVIEGNVKDADVVNRAVNGQDAVVSALGANHMYKYDPVVVAGLANILDAMTSAQVKRFIYLSTLGVKATRHGAGFMIRVIAPIVLRTEIKGHENREKTIINSPLQWTIVHAPILTNGPITRKYRASEELVSGHFAERLSRADVAHCMLSQLSEKAFVRKSLSVMA